MTSIIFCACEVMREKIAPAQVSEVRKREEEEDKSKKEREREQGKERIELMSE